MVNLGIGKFWSIFVEFLLVVVLITPIDGNLLLVNSVHKQIHTCLLGVGSVLKCKNCGQLWA